MDSKGLIVKGRDRLKPHSLNFAHEHDEIIGIANAVESLSPNVLIGATGQRGIFDRNVIEAMFRVAAKAVAGLVTESKLNDGNLFPELDQIREVSLAIGVATSRFAFEQGLAGIDESGDLHELISARMYKPEYEHLVEGSS